MSNVPKLRFKEFSGDWESKKLGELGEFKKTYSFSRSVEGEGNYKHIHYGDIHMNYKGIISKYKLIPSIDIPNDDRYELIKERDIIFADASEDRRDLGKVAVVRSIEGDILSGLHTFCFRPNEFLNSEFFLNHSLNKEYLKFMYTRGNGAKVLGISKSNLAEYNFLAPSKEEQEKIASFFSLIDDKISLQGEKVEAFKDYKKGLMQKIFSRELRFKDDDGRDYPEWEEKKLGEVSDVRDGTHDSPKYIDNGFRFITSKNLSSNGKINFNDINYISEEDYININKRSKVDIGDILFGMIGTIGNPVIVEEDGFAIKNVALIKQKEILLNKYLIQVLNSSIVNKQFHVLNAGGTQKFIALGVIRDLIIPIPTNEEQLKIIKVLSNIDLKIEKEQEKLDSLNEYKKGLLQQMFV